jgi:hypothetical protein
MAVPVTPRNSADFSSLGIVQAAVLGLTDARYNANADLQFIPNMDGFPNGRRLEDDVTTIELQAVSGVALAAIGLWYDDYNGTGSPVTTDLVNVLSYNAGVTHNDTTLKTNFPFVQAPWRGFTGAGYVGPKSLDPLPVTFVSFVANKKDNFVNLNWEVTNEVNNSHYDVERSLGSVRSFAKIGSVTARTGNTNIYNFTDVAPSLDQANYYRLKQVDKDGKFSYSPIRVIAFNPDNVLTVSPNPANGFIKITSSAANVQVVIYDLTGKRVAAMQLNSGVAQMSTSKLSKGLYTVVAQSNGTKLAEKKIVVQ